MNAARIILLGALAMALVGGLAFIVLGEKPEPPPSQRVWRNEACQACHPEVWEEWNASWHRLAYVDPLYTKLSANHTDTSCDDCHIPRNIPEVGFGPRTLPRVSDKESGINCLSCHHDGRNIVAARARPDAGCQPIRVPDLSTEMACIGCHNQHKLHEEWRRTPYYRQGVTCIDCHMPEVERRRGEARITGRHHGFIASRNRDFRRSAVAVRVKGPGDPGGQPGVVQVAITNETSGHDFPSDSRHKSADLITRFLAAGEQPVGKTHQERFHIPARDALDQTRTTIPHGETRSFLYRIPEDAVQAEVRLLYRILKDDPQDDSQQLFRRVIRW